MGLKDSSLRLGMTLLTGDQQKSAEFRQRNAADLFHLRNTIKNRYELCKIEAGIERYFIIFESRR
jgi:hypothetical protein